MAGFVAIKSEVIARLGNRSDLDSRAEVWINDAYFELLLSPRFSFFELERAQQALTGNGQRSYSLPSDLWFILDIRDSTHSVKLWRDHWSRQDKTTPSSGFPTRYARFGPTIELDPTPNGVYTLIMRYRQRPGELTTSAPNTGIGREWDEVITKMACIKGFEALQQQDKANATKEMLEVDLAKRIDVPQLEDMDAETTLGVELGGLRTTPWN